MCNHVCNHGVFLGVVGATAMNEESSRSHAIFTITIESSRDNGDGSTYLKMGKLHLVDLAVSKKNKIFFNNKLTSG